MCSQEGQETVEEGTNGSPDDLPAGRRSRLRPHAGV